MGKGITAIALATPLPDWASISGIYSVQNWLYDEAVPSYGHSVPAQYPEIKKLVRFFSFVGHVSDCRRNDHAPETAQRTFSFQAGVTALYLRRKSKLHRCPSDY